MSGHRSRRRRVAAVATGITIGATLLLLAPSLAPGAGALIGNPGNVRAALRITVRTPTLDLSTTSAAAIATATVHQDGTIEIPQASLTFEPIDVQGLTGVTATVGGTPTTLASSDATVHLVSVGSFAGMLEPTTGAGFLVGKLSEMWTLPGSTTTCSVGPFRVVLKTNSPGARLYSSSTGQVTMVDAAPSIDAVQPATAGCTDLAGAIDAAQSLPVTTTTTTTTIVPAGQTASPAPTATAPPASTVALALTFEPAPIGVAPPPRRPPATSPPPTVHRSTPVVPPPPPSGSITTSARPPVLRPHRAHHSAHDSHASRSGNTSLESLLANSHLSKSERARLLATLRHDQALAAASRARMSVLAAAAARATAPAAAHRKTFYLSRPAAPLVQVPKTTAASGAANLATASLGRHGRSAWSTTVQLAGLLALIVSVAAGLALVTAEVSNQVQDSRRRRDHLARTRV